MSIIESATWKEDLVRAANAVPPGDVREGVYLVTGASGLIGSAFVDLLLYLRDSRGTKLSVVVAGRDVDALVARFGQRDGVSFLAYDATRRFDFASVGADFIVHAAGNASPDLYMKDPCGTLAANIFGLVDILECARAESAVKVLYVSSSEVYGVRMRKCPASEEDYGKVDPLDVRSSYAEGKRAAEALCAAYSVQHGVNVSIVRPGHVYGPTATAKDHRVSSEFPRLAAMGMPIVLKSAGKQRRSYCHCLDCATAMISVIAHGKTATPYNISNPGSIITIREMAEMLAEAGGVQISYEVPTPSEKAAFNPMDDASIEAARLFELGWRPVFGARTGLARTVAVLKDIIA